MMMNLARQWSSVSVMAGWTCRAPKLMTGSGAAAVTHARAAVAVDLDEHVAIAMERGHDVTLFATADSTTKAKLHAIYPHGYWHDENMWPWELYDMLNLAAAVERHLVRVVLGQRARAAERDLLADDARAFGLASDELVGHVDVDAGEARAGLDRDGFVHQQFQRL